MKTLLALVLAAFAADAHAMRLGAKLQIGETPPKIWVIEMKDDKSWESRTEGKLNFRFNMEPSKKDVVVHVEVFEVGDKKTEQIVKTDVRARWGNNAEVIEAVNGYAIHLWLRPTRK